MNAELLRPAVDASTSVSITRCGAWLYVYCASRIHRLLPSSFQVAAISISGAEHMLKWTRGWEKGAREAGWRSHGRANSKATQRGSTGSTDEDRTIDSRLIPIELQDVASMTSTATKDRSKTVFKPCSAMFRAVHHDFGSLIRHRRLKFWTY